MEICAKGFWLFVIKILILKFLKIIILHEDDKLILDQYSKHYENLIKYSDNQDVNSYINFIVEQLFAANKYFNDQEPWKKKMIN